MHNFGPREVGRVKSGSFIRQSEPTNECATLRKSRERRALLPDDGIPEGGQIFSLTCSQINRRVGSLCEAAGMPGEYAASSPRVGKAIDLADSGMSVEDLRAYGRWRSLDSAWAYVQRSPSYAKVRRLRSMTTGKE